MSDSVGQGDGPGQSDPRRPRTAFVLAGGGLRGAFEVGALQHLMGPLGITPDVITATSAGAMLGVVLAQARTPGEFAERLDQARGNLMAMTDIDLVFGRQPVMDELEGTAAADSIRRFLRDRTRPDLPGGEPDPDVPAGGAEPASGGADPTREVPGDAAVTTTAQGIPALVDRHPRARRAWVELASLAQAVPVVNRARKDGAQPAVLNLDPWEDAIRGKVDIGVAEVDPHLVARPGLDLRMAITAVRARETHYVCGDGTVVGPDALSPLPPPDPDKQSDVVDDRPFDLIDGMIASASIPGVMPPRRLGAVTYVDGGVLQNVPLAAAVALGATRIFTVLAVPVGEPQRGLTRWAARELGLVSTQADNLAVALPDGTTNVVIEPTVEVVGALEVHRGLMAIAIDYGRMRAEEAFAEVDPALRPLLTQTSDAIAVERGRAWRVEQNCLLDDSMSTARRDALRRLKDAVHRAVDARTALGMPEPADATNWWTGWELHSRPVPDHFPAVLA